jgi:copper homeostasis protein
MQHEGLTPAREHMVAARAAFRDRAGLFVMIRPRGGGFSYTIPERRVMREQIKIAAAAGADGIVLGVLREDDSRLCMASLHELMETGRQCGLKVAFHRAFDATPEPLETLEQLMDAGVDRILTSGTPWGSRESALSGIGRLKQTCDFAGERIEVVIGGGMNSGNAASVLQTLPLRSSRIAVHAYSGVQENGVTTAEAVGALVKSVQAVCLPGDL